MRKGPRLELALAGWIACFGASAGCSDVGGEDTDGGSAKDGGSGRTTPPATNGGGSSPTTGGGTNDPVDAGELTDTTNPRPPIDSGTNPTHPTTDASLVDSSLLDTGGAIGDASSSTVICGDAQVTGAPFAPVTSYTGNDGGFGSVATRRVGDATSGTVSIFRPKNYGQNGVLHPIVVWGNGFTNTVDSHAAFLGKVASYGFVVVAPEQTSVTPAQMRSAIDYVVRLANTTDCGKIDTNKIAATGYSLGATGALAVATDDRVTATFLFSGGVNGAKEAMAVKHIWAGVTGEADTVVPPANAQAFVNASTQPGFYAVLVGKNHNQVADTPVSQEAYIAFLRWRFMGDAAGRAKFVGPTCGVCADKTDFVTAYSKGYDTL